MVRQRVRRRHVLMCGWEGCNLPLRLTLMWGGVDCELELHTL
jgi:hypothetical protein|tara:strand:+ start:169 stop:294 length:126 start_codon:yes stop_codon:yes gene_type:complete